VYRSLKDHGKLVTTSNQKPFGDAKYLALTILKLSQYVSEISRIPVQKWRHISACASSSRCEQFCRGQEKDFLASRRAFSTKQFRISQNVLPFYLSRKESARKDLQ
jgi:hypothetical protein